MLAGPSTPHYNASEYQRQPYGHRSMHYPVRVMQHRGCGECAGEALFRRLRKRLPQGIDQRLRNSSQTFGLRAVYQPDFAFACKDAHVNNGALLVEIEKADERNAGP